MKRLCKYILTNFLTILIFSIIFTIFLFFLSDLFSNLSSFLKNSVSIYMIAEYYFFSTPFIFYYLSPLVFALSSLITLGFMSMRNEIIVMRSSGINIFKIAAPILILSVFFSVFMFLLDEYVVGKSMDKAYFIETFEFNKNYSGNIWVKKDNYFIHIDRLNIKKGVASNVKLYDVVKDGIKKVIYAKQMVMKKNSVILKNAEVEDMNNLGNKKCKATLILDLKLQNSDFAKSPKKSAYSFSQAWKDAKQSKNRSYYLSIIVSKLFYPLSTVILTLLSLVFVLKITPRKSDFIKNVFLGGLSFIIYIGLFEFFISIGKISLINPVAAILFFILLWISFSIYNLLKLGV